MTPSIGRIVHFITRHGVHRPAIIVGVNPLGNEGLSLQVFVDPTQDDTVPFQRNVFHDDTRETRCSWHWPEKVE